MALFWLLVAGVAMALAVIASSRAVDHAARAASGLGVPAFVVGFTLVALGTDLPEIANSVVASVAGHGDVNVGDSVGSAAAQASLVVGLLPFLARRAITLDRRNIAMLGAAAVLGLGLGVLLVADGWFGRGDGAVLVGWWVVAVAVIRRLAREPSQPELPLPERHPAAHLVIALLWLLGVGSGATVAVTGIIRLASALSVPEYLVSFLGLAIGTSLPELVVAVSAVRRRHDDLALGDALGATLSDATVSPGVGPLVAPTAVTADLAVTGGLSTAVLVALSVALIVCAGRVDRPAGLAIAVSWLLVVSALMLAA